MARIITPHLPREKAPGLRRAVLLGAVAAAFPDSDIVIRFFADQLTYLNLHRGVTHSLLLMPLWAALLAWLFVFLKGEQRCWRSYFILSIVGITAHILADVITSYGTQIFAPLSAWKASFPITFIIDPWFTGIIVAGLLASWRWRNTSQPAALALLVLIGYLGFQAVLSAKAVALGEAYASQQGERDAQVTALPQPLSPFNWKLILTEGDHYDVAYVNLRRTHIREKDDQNGFFARLSALYLPADALKWQRVARFGELPNQQMLARTLWNEPEMAGVRHFIEYPALAQINQQTQEGTCVWFDDLRFTLDDIRSPFRFGGCRENAQGAWHLYRLGRDGTAPL